MESKGVKKDERDCIIAMRIEEYIAHRRKEDGIDEYNLEARSENTKIFVNYVFEYFNNYLDSIGGSEETILHNEKIDNYRQRQVKEYSAEVREWLVGLYAAHGKYMHIQLRNMITDKYFYLYDSEAEFRALSYEIYPVAVKRFPFLEGQSEMVYRYIKDYHRICNLMNEEFHISKDIDTWILDTYKERRVNIYNFCCDYVSELFDHPERWPVKHKHKSQYADKYDLKPDDSLYWDYDYRQKNNLFCLDSLYSEMPKKHFVNRKKQYFEAVLLYAWLHGIESDDGYWEEYCTKVGLNE